MIDDFDYLNIEANIGEPIMMLSSLLYNFYEKELYRRFKNNLISQGTVRLVISVLARENGMTQNQIVRATHLNGTTVSLTVKALEKEGYLNRIPDTYDKRRIRAYLTTKGIELDIKRKQIIRELDEIGKDKITSRTIDAAVFTLRNYIANLLEHIKE